MNIGQKFLWHNIPPRFDRPQEAKGPEDFLKPPLVRREKGKQQTTQTTPQNIPRLMDIRVNAPRNQARPKNAQKPRNQGRFQVPNKKRRQQSLDRKIEAMIDRKLRQQ